MGIFVSVGKTVECAATAAVFAALLLIVNLKPLGILQEAGYKGGKMLGWVFRKSNILKSRVLLLATAVLLSYSVIALCFSFAGAWAAVIALSAFLIFCVLYIYADAKVALKSPIIFTPRFKRLCAAVWLVYAVVIYACVTLLNFADAVWGARIFSYLRYAPLSLIFLLGCPLACLGNLITLIYEAPRNRSFVKKAERKLKQSGVRTVAVTGSYGKTTVKNILAAMLGTQYKVVATPASYNTPLGVAKTVNGADFDGADFFIAEMGARHVGDVAELCRYFPPEFSVISGVCPQHLESFKTLENIVKTKGEIIAPTKRSCFVAPDCFDYYKESPKAVCGACVSEVSVGADGTEFNITLDNVTQRVKTVLLGEAAAHNIGLCACAAFALGVSRANIIKAIEQLDFVEHRLQLIKSNGVFILDDSYNSNVTGAKAAVDVLKLFGGKKIVITPGLVELGVLEQSENFALGERLAGLDRVILVGETLVTAVKDGYLSAGGDAEKLVIVPTLAAAQENIKGGLAAGDAILFLNDLPDLYL